MKKKPVAPTGPKCPSTNSGYACALTGDHTVHCNKEKRSKDYLTWETIEDGRIKVTAHQGKNENTWYDEAPEAPPPGSLHVPGDTITMDGVTYTYAAPDAIISIAVQNCTFTERTEAEPVTTEPATPGFTEDPEPKPGDTRTNQHGHYERWCWGPVGGFGWREYKAKGKGCPGCGRHKVDCLCKQMKAMPAAPAPVAEPEQPREPLTKIGEYEVHPAAALFPMISDADYPTFLMDIAEKGQRKRIVLLDGRILDGRNRLRAVLQLGRVPLFRDFGSEPSDGSDPIAFVVSENVHRRHLNETQRAFVGAELVPMYAAEAKERQRAAGGSKPVSANLREAGKAAGKATEAAARAVNVSAKSVEAALKVKRDGAPEVLAAAKDRGHLKVSAAAKLSSLPKSEQRDIVAKVGNGEIRSGKVTSLVNQEKKRDIVRKINAQNVAPMPLGPFGVIYGDYPWWYDNSDQHEGSRGHMPYPPMSMEEIIAHARATASRAAKHCILALWSTNLYVVDMKPVLDAYGAVQRTVCTWPKERAGVGSWPRGQTEHLVIASIGEPTHTLNELSTLLPSWKPEHQGEHSSKPAEVAELLRKHCSGPFLELFGRGPREGFVVWGAEAEKFATEAA